MLAGVDRCYVEAWDTKRSSCNAVLKRNEVWLGMAAYNRVISRVAHETATDSVCVSFAC
jgi:hypothetical protein